MITVTLALSTPAYYKTNATGSSPSSPAVSQSLTDAAQAAALSEREPVKMAVLIRWRIRAVVFNQSGQWQSPWCSRGGCDDDSCWRGKHWKYTCTLICSLWGRAYSAMSVLRAAFWEKEVVGRKGEVILELQKHTGLYGWALSDRTGRCIQIILLLGHETWYCLGI